MRRKVAIVLLAGATAAMAAPRTATAQLSVGVRLYWTWTDGAWRPHRYDWDGRRSAYYLEGRAVWVSEGHLPPPGYCREWIPGVPAWRQPPPVPCDRLFGRYGYARAGVVILGSVGFSGPVLRTARVRPVVRVERDRWRQRVNREDVERVHRNDRAARTSRNDRARVRETAARVERGRVSRDDHGRAGSRGHEDRGRAGHGGRGRGGG